MGLDLVKEAKAVGDDNSEEAAGSQKQEDAADSSDDEAVSFSPDLSFEQMQELEKGAIANPDENQMVGHYWLRNPTMSLKWRMLWKRTLV